MIDTIAKNLRAMPYPEMMQFAKLVAAHLPAGNNHLAVAEALIKACNQCQPSDLMQKEAKVLLQAFTRKRVVNVKKFSTGYAIEVPTLPGSVVTGTDLRAMFGLMLDQIVTMEVLGGGSTRVK